jgi:hypothetical protein
LHETPVLQAFPEQFPTQANRENILRNREFLAGKQRILAHEALVRTHHNPAGPLPVSMPTNGCFAPEAAIRPLKVPLPKRARFA